MLNDGEADQSATGKAASPIDETAVGESGSDRRVRPVDLAMVSKADELKSYPLPAFLKDTVQQLQLLEQIAVELLTHSQHDGWTVPVSVLADEDGEIDSKLLIITADENAQMRRAAVFALKHEGEHVCVVVIEGVPAHTKIYTTTGQSADEIWETLKCATFDYANGTHDLELAADLTGEIRWIFGLDETHRY